MNFFKIITLSTLVLSVCACENVKTNKAKTTDSESVDITQNTSSLQDKLDERSNNFNKKVDDSTKKIYKKGLDAVKNSGVIETAKKVGDEAPNFNLKNAVGETIELKDYLAKGPVVLTWYRGGWCPYCNLALHSLQEELPNFKAEGATLIALSPELPDESITTTEKHSLEFEVLSDLGNVVAREYGVVYKLEDELAKKYNQKFDLNNHNGDTSNELPIAATYIINTDGKIVYAFLNTDYKKRAEPSVITKFLKDMKK